MFGLQGTVRFFLFSFLVFNFSIFPGGKGGDGDKKDTVKVDLPPPDQRPYTLPDFFWGLGRAVNPWGGNPFTRAGKRISDTAEYLGSSSIGGGLKATWQNLGTRGLMSLGHRLTGSEALLLKMLERDARKAEAKKDNPGLFKKIGSDIVQGAFHGAGKGAKKKADSVAKIQDDIINSKENIYEKPAKVMERLVKDSPFLVAALKKNFRKVYARFCYYAKHPSELLYKKEPRLLIAWLAGATCLIMSMGLAPKIIFRQIEKSLDQPKLIFKTDRIREMGPAKLILPMATTMAFMVWRMIGAGRGYVLDKDLAGRIESANKLDVSADGEQLSPLEQRLKKHGAAVDFFAGAAMGTGVFCAAFFVQKMLLQIYDGMRKEPQLSLARDFIAPDEETEQSISGYINRVKAWKASGQRCNDLILLHGPKGTGKTEFSKMLASHLGYGWAVINSGSVSSTKDVSGELLKLIEWAFKKDVVLIFDECGDYLGPKAEDSSAGRIFKNTFCQLCGTAKARPMIIMIDNDATNLDGRIIDRGGRISFKQELNAPMGAAATRMLEKLLMRKFAEIRQGKRQLSLKFDSELYEGLEPLMESLVGLQVRVPIRDLESWAHEIIRETLCRDQRIVDGEVIRVAYKNFMASRNMSVSGQTTAEIG